MPGTGDITYVLGPSLVALAVGVLILVVVRARSRGPAVTQRSAPEHGPLPSAAGTSDADDVKSRIPAQRDAATRAADGENLVIRLSEDTRARAVSRRVLSRP